MTLDKLGYIVMAIGGVLLLSGLDDPVRLRSDTGMWTGTAIFIAGVVVTAMALSRPKQ